MDCRSKTLGSVLSTNVKMLFGGGSLIVLDSISLPGKTGLVISEGTLNVERYKDVVLQQVAIIYFLS